MELYYPVKNPINEQNLCLNCSISFSPKRKIKNRISKYCSRACYYNRPKPRCLSCKSECNTGRKYCSTKCFFDSRKGYHHTTESRKKMSLSIMGRKDTMETRLKKRIARLGHNNPAWKGGIDKDKLFRRKSVQYTNWRNAVFIRDGYRCLDCGAKNGETGHRVILNADHIYPYSIYPRLRYEVENGRTLCLDCHRKTNTYGGRAIKLRHQFNATV